MAPALLRMIAATAALLASATASAQGHQAALDPSASTASVVLDTRLASSGHLIGAYDATSNPGGTQTRPGFFGGSGNNPIPVTADIDGTSAADSAPDGAFSLQLDVPALTIGIEDLGIDLLAGATVPAVLTASLSYATFNTINPTFIYVSGVPINVPLGDVGEIRQLDLVQAAPAQGQLSVTADPHVFDFSVEIPATLSITVRVALPDAEPIDLPLDPLPVLLPASGSVDRSEPGVLRISVVVEPQALVATIDLAGLAYPPIPLELPTLGTETASVILHMAADSLALDGSLALQLHAEAATAVLPDAVFADGFE
jgi:hypothetical protein